MTVVTFLDNQKDYSKSLKAIAFIHPTPYTTTNVSDRIEEKDGVKEWNDGSDR